MIFGGLSEKELKTIMQLLDQQGIDYQVKEDEIISQSNTDSMKNNLRHLNPPSISTHILAIEINDTDFNKMDESLSAKLLNLGITNQLPESFSEAQELINPSAIHQDILSGNKKIIALGFIHQLAIILVIAFITYLMAK